MIVKVIFVDGFDLKGFFLFYYQANMIHQILSDQSI